MTVVLNRLFNQEWKVSCEKHRDSKYNEASDKGKLINSFILPPRSTIRSKLKQIQAYSLGLVVNEIVNTDATGAETTHSTD